MSAPWGPEDVDAQLRLEGRLPGFWQVYRFREERCFPSVRVPPGWYYAAFWDRDEPLVVAETLDELERLVHVRMDAMPIGRHHPNGRAR